MILRMLRSQFKILLRDITKWTIYFKMTLTKRCLIFFSDWLLQNVYLVEITAYTDEDAYTIFETMNDRGLSLNPLDMLKGFLLASITDPDKRNKAVDIWKNWLEKLRVLGKDEDSDAFENLVAQPVCPDNQEQKTGRNGKAIREKIGTEFHRWLKDNTGIIKLNKSDDFYNFINKDLQIYVREFIKLKNAAQSITPGIEPVYYNAKLAFTLQYPLLFSAVTCYRQ